MLRPEIPPPPPSQSMNRPTHSHRKTEGGRSPGEAQLCKHKSLTAADSSGDISDHADRAWEHMPFLQTREISDKGRLGLAWHGLAWLGLGLISGMISNTDKAQSSLATHRGAEKKTLRRLTD
ncbi:hypothetical protein E3U43_015740 [Larimichthys crocea]|uniref:Uncharacterized protein n=1 Tax=Larimichthys crocea TaxID=215358 RepID=A0ACD3RQZ1_LARCR|nr:hypothetical protein E3U43_015740 [Larimichthys crocea]